MKNQFLERVKMKLRGKYRANPQPKQVATGLFAEAKDGKHEQAAEISMSRKMGFCQK
jgi:hypothetical protein